MKDKRGFVFGDTVLEGMWVILKDGSKEFIKCEKPIILTTAEENNKHGME